MNKHAGHYELEDLVAAPSPGPGQKDALKAKRQRREAFVVTTATQAQKLDGATSLTVERVFRHLQFRWYRAYRKPFRLPGDALSGVGINRKAQWRALASLAKLKLISIEHGGGRKPPLITII